MKNFKSIFVKVEIIILIIPTDLKFRLYSLPAMKDEEISTLLPFYTSPPTIFISFMIRFYIIKVYSIYLLLDDFNPIMDI